MGFKIIEAEAARALGREEKWALLSPSLREHGRQALSYSTLQAGMEYFIDEHGYIAYTTAQHPVLARRPRKMTLVDPVCAVDDYPRIIRNFLSVNPRAMFGVISETCAQVLREMGFKANCIGFEPELPVQTYNTRGNWKELDLIKRARNEARREGITVREESHIETVSRQQLDAISSRWIGAKRIKDREIWIYARRPVFEYEEDVRKFVAYDRDGRVAGFVFYDPMYDHGRVIGYSANISRCDEQRFGRLATAIHMEAMERFKAEGKEVLNLCLATFVKLDGGKFNDDRLSKKFFELSARYGNSIYNFEGLAFHKAKYRGRENYIYFASNNPWPSNDIYLAFRSADITRNYLAILGQLVWGMITARRNGKPTSPRLVGS